MEHQSNGGNAQAVLVEPPGPTIRGDKFCDFLCVIAAAAKPPLKVQGEQGEMIPPGVLFGDIVARLMWAMRCARDEEEDGKDITSEKIHAVWREYDEGKCRTNWWAWLLTCCCNKLSDVRKKRVCEASHCEEKGRITGAACGDRFGCWEQECLRAAIAALPDGPRRLLLDSMEGRTTSELANDFGVHVRTINRRLNDAREAIRKRLGG